MTINASRLRLLVWWTVLTVVCRPVQSHGPHQLGDYIEPGGDELKWHSFCSCSTFCSLVPHHSLPWKGPSVSWDVSPAVLTVLLSRRDIFSLFQFRVRVRVNCSCFIKLPQTVSLHGRTAAGTFFVVSKGSSDGERLNKSTFCAKCE